MKKPKKIENVGVELFSNSERLARELASAGFRKRNGRSRSAAEFAKTYSDPSGRLARVTVVVAYDPSGLELDRVTSFVVTTQSVILPDKLTNVPAFCQTDVSKVLSLFAPDSSPDGTVTCPSCGQTATALMGDVCSSCST